MRKNRLLSTVFMPALMLALGTCAYASTVWHPAANGVYPPAAGNWGDAANWTNGVPVAVGNSTSYGTHTKARFYRTNAAECIVTDARTCKDLVQGDGGPGGVLRIKDGGILTTTGGWMSVGYNSTATLIVESGGALNCGGHMWNGMHNTGIGTIEINGGTVNVSQNFGLGWYNGAQNGIAHFYVNSGLLSLHHWDGTQSIHDGSILDIESGSVTINGDRTGDVAGYIAAGKITAYGGTGTVVYDYNVTNTGKTTIKAVEGVDGDVDGDGGVNYGDLYLFAQSWLVSACDSDANFDEWCLIDFRDFVILASNWMTGIFEDWHIASTQYPTDDMIVTPYYADNFGIVGDGVTDVTDELQTALVSVSNLGGGTLFLPAGNYKISGTLTIPSRVTLRGDWQKPEAGSPVAGTILQAYAGRGDEDGTPFIGLSGSSGVKGITIWYPEQLPTDIRPYPPTIQRASGGNHSVENVTLVNSYFGFTTYRESITSCPFLRNIYGTPLKTGIEYDCLADIGRIENVHFSPDYWAGSGLANAPTANEHASWIYDNGTGVIVRRIDWSYSAYVTVEGYNIGLALRPSRYDGRPPNGQSYKFTLKDCETGVYIEDSSYAGYQFTRFDIRQVRTGVYLGASADQAEMFHTCNISASDYAILSEGAAKVLMMSNDIENGTVRLDGGYLSVINSDFTNTAAIHIELGSAVRGASILGNSFRRGDPRISNDTSYPVIIDHTPLAVDPLPPYDYKKPESGFKPAKSDLYVVTNGPYYAQADGTSDDTAAFQAALADAGANGGGIVFVPGGNYRIDGNLTVPTGVELRGIFDVPHSPREKGSLLNVYAGRNNANGTPFIRIESGAGIRGLTFHYPEQIYNEADTVNYGMVPYPYLIRGLGSDIYAINIAATIPYQLLDLATYRCDRHYVDYILSTALKTGIHVGRGSTDGQIHNCQFNPSAFTHQSAYYDSIPSGTASGIHEILWRDSTPYLFGNMSGEVLHENFVFGGLRGFHLIEEGGFGPSGYSMGMGVDACTTAFHIDDVGSGGLDMINSQIVSTNKTEGHYLETGASFDDTFRLFSSAGWGGHQYSAVIKGGDVRLQLFHLARDGESGAFRVHNNASLRNLGGNLTDELKSPRPFLTIDPTATAEFIGNIINTPSSNMPSNTFNVTSIGNLRVQ